MYARTNIFLLLVILRNFTNDMHDYFSAISYSYYKRRPLPTKAGLCVAHCIGPSAQVTVCTRERMRQQLNCHPMYECDIALSLCPLHTRGPKA